ncbi:MAG: copper chaperone PCu(A)C [Hyphomicrobiales bacterium]|nr:copper chaperone PCu(A)C [Hyphomicrobiales bacterium]
MLVIACSANAMATDYKAGTIEIVNPWSRATPKGASTAIGYMIIKNTGMTSDRLIGGSVDVAGRLELHSMVMENGVAKMRDLHDIEIKPGQSIEFKPGGAHAMFVNLKYPLSKGERIKGTLVFEHTGTVQIEYSVESIGAQSAPMEMEHM